MTIDFHYHVLAPDVVTPKFRYMIRHVIKQGEGSRGHKISDEAAEDLLPVLWDRDADRELGTQDEAGIALTVLLPLDQGAHMGDAPTDIWEYNRHVIGLARRQPERFAAFCAVEPHRPFALDLLTTAVEEWGAKGLKLVPNGGFSYQEDCLLPLAGKLSDWGLPLLAHTGHWPGHPGGPFNHPSHLERVLTEFPRLVVIATHLSGQWWRDLVVMAARFDNLYCDISCLQPGFADSHDRACHVLRRVLDGFGAHRVLFASDGPSMDYWIPRAQWVRTIARLPEEAPPDIQFTCEEIQAVLHDNAARLLGMPVISQ